jgi:membrane-associated phospholipid phosphatase
MMPPRSTSTAWLSAAGARLRQDWRIKFVGTTAGMMLFFPIYFRLLGHPLRAVTLMPVTDIDRLLGIHAWTLPLYLSLWVYVGLTPGLVGGRRELVGMALAWVALSAVGLGIFFLWPTAVPPLGVEWSQYPSLAFLKATDAAGNACPSLHVGFAVFSAASIGRSLWQLRAGPIARGLNWLWCLGIGYSTITTGQHVLVDVIAGAALGSVVAVSYLRLTGSAGSATS